MRGFVGLLIGCLCLPACSPISPWERGVLAKEHMSLDPAPLQSGLRSHQYGSREAASGGGASSGGGCGCY
ncbi:MAG TPA: arginine decarboxylase [Methylococcaceae bacterium]|nr:arginine decarboxylase [Methylococcaceae bacterium]